MSMQSTTKPAGCSRILDPIELNRAVRAGLGGLDTGASLFVFFVSTLCALAFGAIWWRYDLLSTWNFTQGIRKDVAPEAARIAEQAAAAAAAPELVAVVGGLIGVAITLLPTMVELLAPRVLHAGVQLALNMSILFDFVTDWPTAAAMVGRWGAPGGWIGGVVFTFVITLVISLLVQVLFVLAITALIVSALNIVGIGRSKHGAVSYLIGE